MTIGTEILDAVFGASLGRTGRRLSYSPSGGAADENICARPVGNSPAEFKALTLPGFDVHQEFDNVLMNGERDGQRNGTEP